jgi:hypothetical protein
VSIAKLSALVVAGKSLWGPLMKQIVDWLESLGMSKYAPRFAEDRIDFSVLPDLTDQDLEKIGVILGDRGKMLRAIGEIGTAAPITPEPALPPLGALYWIKL